MPLLTTRAAFSSSGFRASSKRLAVDILVVGGGGGGKTPANDLAGGGGGGGQVTNLVYSLTRGNYNLAVGSGGTGGESPINGTESSFAGYARALPGVAAATNTPYRGGNGGNGSLGGAAFSSSTNFAGGGGAGVTDGGVGGFYNLIAYGFAWYGGIPGPSYLWIDGNRYGQGGGGGALRTTDDVYGGGIGVAGGPRGGAIARSSGLVRPAVAPIDGTGFGGSGGATFSPYTADATDGADGCVIVSYAGDTAVASGGTIVIAGGRVYHKFTTPGSFTFTY